MNRNTLINVLARQAILDRSKAWVASCGREWTQADADFYAEAIEHLDPNDQAAASAVLGWLGNAGFTIVGPRDS